MVRELSALEVDRIAIRVGTVVDIRRSSSQRFAPRLPRNPHDAAYVAGWIRTRRTP